MPRVKVAPTLVLLLSAVASYVALRPVLGLGHELAVAALAWTFHIAVGTDAWEPIVRLLGLDPIYAGAAIRAAGGVQVDGFAVARPLGASLNSALPGIFVSPDRVADGAGISMVAAPGAPAIGRGLAAFGADVVWLTIGLLLFLHWRRASWRVAVLGLLIQAQISINHLMDAQVSLADIDASGLPFAIALAAPGGGWFTSDLGRLSNEVRALTIGAGLVALGYGSSTLLVLIGRAVKWLRRSPPDEDRDGDGSQPHTRRAMVVLSLGLAVATACSPIGALAIGESNWQADPSGYLSSGVRSSHETIRGVGYNPQYAGLAETERTALYQRDFADMRRLGINTIEGWFEAQFDSVTLDNAARNDIGVLMPFELNQDWDYSDPTVRAGILDRVSAYVERYKRHSAVRMWAPGNENLHRILYSHWVSQQDVPSVRARADAFAAFLPELVDRIHAVDPSHPVVYRDAEDVYLSWITNAFAQTGVDRPWLIYGANVYSTARLQEIVSKWPAQWPGRPLLISEFAPGGVGPAERPIGFQQQWTVIRSRPDIVLGGMAYTWATNGPEDLDRVFGLVDATGVPTDGALAALGGSYLAETVGDAPSRNN